MAGSVSKANYWQSRKSYRVLKGNAQFVQKVTFEPLMDFK